MRNKTKIEYTEAGQTLEGWLVHEPRLRGPAPGILLFREFMGLGTYLGTPFPAAHGGLTAKLLVFHGQHDPVVPMVELEAFRQEMAVAGADSRVVVYADAGHGFCNREMDGTVHPWNRYSRLHDERSWRTLRAFLADALAD